MTSFSRGRVQEALGKTARGTLTFKYYIHDTASGYSLEILGPLNQGGISELSCCWETARTTLRNRTLTLDLRRLTSVDETARKWLESMNHEGVKYVPETFMRDPLLAEADHHSTDTPRRSIFCRLSNALRGYA